MPEENNLTSEPAAVPVPEIPMPTLEKFIFEPDEFTDAIVPRRLKSTDVANFLLKKVKKDTSLESWRQVEKAADFYDTTEVPSKYREFLDRKENTSEDVLRSIVIDRVIATLGNADDRDFARQYYLYLIGKIDTIEEFQDIILLHERLDLGSNSAELKKRIQTKLSSLEKYKEDDYEARLRYLKFQETIPSALEAVEKAQAVKDNAVKTVDRQKRLDIEITMYVTTEYGYQDYLLPFAARRIRRETWAANPSEQIVRNDAQPLKSDVVTALRRFLDHLEKDNGFDKEDKEAFRLRTLRAIRFFDGQLSDHEQGILREHRGKQVDVLANEGFMIKS